MNFDAEQFNREGFAFFPEAFDKAEVMLLKRAAAEALAAKRQENRWDVHGSPYMAFACHLFDPLLDRLVRLPRVVETAKALLGEPVYLHQFRIDAKPGCTADIEAWHQNFALWKEQDGMVSPRVVNVAIFLNDVDATNGPMLLIPRSHRSNGADDAHPTWTLDNDSVTRLGVVDKA